MAIDRALLHAPTMRQRESIDDMINYHCRSTRTRLREELVILGGMAVKKITAAERLVQEQMLAILEWASERPDEWHNIGKLDATKEAAKLLAARGVIEIWPKTGLYRLKPKG